MQFFFNADFNVFHGGNPGGQQGRTRESAKTSELTVAARYTILVPAGTSRKGSSGAGRGFSPFASSKFRVQRDFGRHDETGNRRQNHPDKKVFVT
jgi:hypothetical protein